MKPKDSNIDKPNFKLPDSYFDRFQERLDAQVALDHILGGKVGSGFNVPEGYFKNLKVDVNVTSIREDMNGTLSRKRTPQELPDTTKIINLNTRKWYWTAASVAAILVIAISIFPWSSAETPTFDSLEIAEIEAYVENQDIAFSNYELGDMLTDEAFETLESTAYFEDATLIEYLENNVEDDAIFIE